MTASDLITKAKPMLLKVIAAKTKVAVSVSVWKAKVAVLKVTRGEAKIATDGSVREKQACSTQGYGR